MAQCRFFARSSALGEVLMVAMEGMAAWSSAGLWRTSAPWIIWRG